MSTDVEATFKNFESFFRNNGSFYTSQKHFNFLPANYALQFFSWKCLIHFQRLVPVINFSP